MEIWNVKCDGDVKKATLWEFVTKTNLVFKLELGLNWSICPINRNNVAFITYSHDQKFKITWIFFLKRQFFMQKNLNSSYFKLLIL